MLQDRHGPIDYCERGSGPTIVLVPGSFATQSAWSGVAEALSNRFRTVTTSLPGHGGTRESRTASNCSIDRSSEAVEAVVRRTGGPVHLVGHSYGAMVCLDLALCGLTPLMSLTLIEPVAFGLLRRAGEPSEQFADMHAAHVRAVEADERDAARRVFDYLGGPGQFDALPSCVRERITATTPSHVLDTRSGFDPTVPALRNILLPTRVLRGERTARSLHTCAHILSRAMANASLHTIAGAGHFMTATHAAELAGHIGDHVMKAEKAAWADLSFASPFGLAARSE